MPKTRQIATLSSIILAALAAVFWAISSLPDMPTWAATDAGLNGAMCAALAALAEMSAHVLDPQRPALLDRHAHKAAVLRGLSRAKCWLARAFRR